MYIVLFILLVLLMLLDIRAGAIHVDFASAFSAYRSGQHTSHSVILFLYRLPKAITAVLVGISLSASGLQMQILFRNPLADPYILGVSAGAGLGVALFLLGVPLFGAFTMFAMGQAMAAWIGAAAVMMLLVVVSMRIRDIMAILVLGVIFGSAVSSIITLLQYFGQASALKSYVLWTMGSIGVLDMQQISVLVITTFVGGIAALLSCKTLNILMLGEDYARTLGCRIGLQRTLLILTATLLTGAVTAFCGPIGFVGIAVPHAARMLCRRADNRILMPVSMLLGACTLLLCDILSHIPNVEVSLPINVVTSLFGIPVVIFVIIRNQKTI
jgi:iron complex transport system permease protein